jgi:hypothetical protein
MPTVSKTSGWDDPNSDVQYSGKHAYYYAQLVGPGADGEYTIRQSHNDCTPDCALSVRIAVLFAAGAAARRPLPGRARPTGPTARHSSRCRIWRVDYPTERSHKIRAPSARLGRDTCQHVQ